MSWFNSLDSVVRFQQILSWVGVISAILAAVCGVLAYYLNNQARTLHVRQVEERMAEETLEAPSDEDSQQSPEAGETVTGDDHENGEEEGFVDHAAQIVLLEEQIEGLRADLRRSDEEAEGARAQVAQAQDEAQALRSELEELRQQAEQLEDRAEEAEEDAEQARQDLREEEEDEEEAFIQGLRDAPSGPVDIVAVQGVEGARETARKVQSLLERAGWSQVQVREAQFEGTPEGVYFVVHSQPPEYAVPLAIGLAAIDLMPVRPRVKTNPNKAPGYLGLVIGVR